MNGNFDLINTTNAINAMNAINAINAKRRFL